MNEIYEFEDCLRDMKQIATLEKDLKNPRLKSNARYQFEKEQMTLLTRVRDYLWNNVAVGGG